MFRASMVALVTPFLKDKVDLNSLRNLIELHIDAGTSAIIVAGTTGEAGTLSDVEKLLVIKTSIAASQKRVPIIAGTGKSSTKETIEFTKMALECGVDGALIMTPAYIKPTQEGLYQHYREIAKAVPIPIILYNVPHRTGCDLQPQTVANLSKISNIIGIKEALGEMSRLQDILGCCDGQFDVYSGDDLTAADWLSNGAKGVISVTANVAMAQMVQLSDAALNFNHEICEKMQALLLPLNQLLFIESNPIPVKWAMHKMGLLADELRLPLTCLSTKYHAPLEKVLQSLQLV